MSESNPVEPAVVAFRGARGADATLDAPVLAKKEQRIKIRAAVGRGDADNMPSGSRRTATISARSEEAQGDQTC